MKRWIIAIEEAESVVKKFFLDDNDFTDAFMHLANYILMADTQVIVRGNDDIIGISRTDTRFHFYISDDETRYYIKFINRDKESFDVSKIEIYEKYCLEAVCYINNTPECILREQTATTSEDYLFTKENKILEDSYEVLKSLGDDRIPYDLLGTRAYNALMNAGIQTCGDLAGKSAQELLQIKNFGTRSLNATCKAVSKLSKKDELICTKKPCEIDNNIGIKVLRERTYSLLAEQKHRTLCANDETREAASNFRKNFSVIIENMLKNADLVSKRSTRIICERIFNTRTLADIADDYGLTRERIRQICKKTTSRIKGKISNGKMPDEFADAISKLICDINDKTYFDCMYMVRENDDFLWELLSGIIAEKEDIKSLNDFLNECKKLSSAVMQEGNIRTEEKIERKKTYREFQNEEPNVVFLIKSGYFYSAYGYSAEVLNLLLDYKLYYMAKQYIPSTGGPDLAKIQRALEDADISYAVIINGKIEIRFEGSKCIEDFVKVNHKPNELLESIEMMQQGIDPSTGEILDQENFLLSENVQKILHMAKAELLRGNYYG